MSEPEKTTEEMVKLLDNILSDEAVAISEGLGWYFSPSDYRKIEAIRQCLIDYAELTKKLSEVKLDVQNPNRLDVEE